MNKIAANGSKHWNEPDDKPKSKRWGQLTIPVSSVKSREGNGTPLQYSCLETPMDGGAWRAAVHGITKSQTRLNDFTFTFHFPALEKEMETHSSVLAWRIPGMGEPGGLPSMESHRVGHDWSNLAGAAAAAAALKGPTGGGDSETMSRTIRSPLTQGAWRWNPLKSPTQEPC